MAGATATQQPKAATRRAGAGANGAAAATQKVATPRAARSGTRAQEAAGEARASPPWKQPKVYRDMGTALGKLDSFNLQILERIQRGECGLADLQVHCGIKADNGAGTLALRQYLDAMRRAGWLDVDKNGGDGNFRYAFTPRGRAMASAFGPLHAEFGGNSS